MAKASEKGRRFIQNYEALRLQTYDDATGAPVNVGGFARGTLTIGFGHTGPDVVPGLIITRVRADELFSQDLKRFEAGVESVLKRAASQAQFDSLVSLAYNIGLGQFEIPGTQPGRGFRGSTVLKEFNKGNLAAAANAFIMWINDDGKISVGLVKRRVAEIVQFLGG